MPTNHWGSIERPTSSTNMPFYDYSKFIHVFKSTTFTGMAVKSVMKMPSMHNISLSCYCEQLAFQSRADLLRSHLTGIYEVLKDIIGTCRTQDFQVGETLLHGSFQIHDGFLLLQELQRKTVRKSQNTCRIQTYDKNSCLPTTIAHFIELANEFSLLNLIQTHHSCYNNHNIPLLAVSEGWS